MLMCPLDEICDKDYCITLFACEVFRVFRDRLINAEDRRHFSVLSHNIMEHHMKMDWKLEEFEDILFGDYDN